MTLEDARTIAERLGVPQEAVRSVQRHGFLRRLDLDEQEIRERLWRGHLAFLASRPSLHTARVDEQTAPPGSGAAPATRG